MKWGGHGGCLYCFLEVENESFLGVYSATEGVGGREEDFEEHLAADASTRGLLPTSSSFPLHQRSTGSLASPQRWPLTIFNYMVVVHSIFNI